MESGRDVLLAMLFKLVLQKAEENTDMTGSVIYRMVQVQAYADDVVLLVRNKGILKEIFE